MGFFFHPYRQGISYDFLGMIPKEKIIDNANPNILEKMCVIIFFNFLDYTTPDIDLPDQKMIADYEREEFTLCFLVSNNNTKLRNKIESHKNGKFRDFVFTVEDACEFFGNNPRSRYNVLNCLFDYESEFHKIEYNQMQKEKRIANDLRKCYRIRLREIMETQLNYYRASKSNEVA